MNKNPKQTTETREKLKNAFWELYGQKKIETIKVKEITDLAGFNRGTFYVYYKDVYEVLENTQQEIFSDINQNFPSLIDFINNPANPIEGIYEFIRLYEKYHKYLNVLLGESGDPYFIHQFKETVKGIFYNKLRLAQVSDQEVLNYVLEYITSAQIGIITYWFKDNKSLPIEKIVTLSRVMLTTGGFTVLSGLQ